MLPYGLGVAIRAGLCFSLASAFAGLFMCGHCVKAVHFFSLSRAQRQRGETERPLYSTHWFRVVLDEAHCIKNRQSASAAAAFALTSDTRWCLTGTPIQVRLT